jgi:hypothetical protein
MRKLALGLVLIIGALVWKFAMTPRFDSRYPPNWTYRLNSLGLSSYPDETGKFLDGTTLKDTPINLTVRDISISKTNPDGTIVLSDHYKTLDPATKATT